MTYNTTTVKSEKYTCAAELWPDTNCTERERKYTFRRELMNARRRKQEPAENSGRTERGRGKKQKRKDV